MKNILITRQPKPCLFLSSGICALGEIGVDEAVDVAVHDVLDIAVFKLAAGVLDELIGHENVGADGAAEVYLHLHALDVADLLEVFALLDLRELGPEHFLAVLKVLEMAALHLRGDDDTGGQVRETHGRGGLVDLLSAGAGGAVDVHLYILVAKLYLLAVGDRGHDLDGGKARLAAGVRVKGGDADETVYAMLAAQEAVGVLALDLDGGGFYARLVAVLIIHDGAFVVVALGPADIHAVEH